MGKKLKQCPNCGHKPTLVHTRWDCDSMNMVQVVCPVCFLRTYNHRKTKDSEREWNERIDLHFRESEFVPFEKEEKE